MFLLALRNLVGQKENLIEIFLGFFFNPTCWPVQIQEFYSQMTL